MQEVGEIMHLAGSGRVIIQLTSKLAEGQILCDETGTKVAKVMELIGPIKRPFASATPLTNNIKKYIGKSVFAYDYSPANTQKFRRRKK
ncbi:MAG TPA: Gar1/Naf1 family protein [Nitrosarchaeum sp.]|nr:Gar1/Naf1 family protein [Nitrosarchaeum sp.]